uniref:G_PROTEIN_RECEP_F1_2 domain-containing protein n=1 Tax=Steinernema glaseri TaxID=37863 RepID=A0A1I8AHF9_9BILA
MFSDQNVEICHQQEVYGNGRAMNCNGSEDLFYDSYWNTCTSATMLQFLDSDMTTEITLIYGFLLPILSCLVVVTNGIVIFVLSCQKSKTSTIDPLLAMAVCALCGAIVPLPFTLWYYTFDHKNDINQHIELCYLHKICMEVLPFFFNTLVTLFTLLLGCQRFVAVHYPLESVYWCTRQMMHRFSSVIVAVTLFWTFLHCIVESRVIYHFCLHYGDVDTTIWVARCFIGHSEFVKEIGVNAFVMVFDFCRLSLLVFVPSTILFAITVLLIRTIRTADKMELSKQRHHRLSSRTSSRNTTIMLVVIILIFLLARVPSTVCIILAKITEIFPKTSDTLAFATSPHIQAIANIIVIAVHPFTFAVYMLMSRRFRVALRRVLGWRFLASDEEVNCFSTGRPTLAQGPFGSTTPTHPWGVEMRTSSLPLTSTSLREAKCLRSNSNQDDRFLVVTPLFALPNRFRLFRKARNRWSINRDLF